MEARSLLLLLVCSPWRLHVAEVGAKTFEQLSGGQSLSNFTSTLHGVRGLGERVLNCERTARCSGGRYKEASRECQVIEGAAKIQNASQPNGSVDFAVECGGYLAVKNNFIPPNTEKAIDGKI